MYTRSLVSLRDHRLVGRDDHRFQVVNLLEFECFGIRRAGHAGQSAVQAEIILEGDRGQCLRFVLDLHAFFGFDRLMQSFRPAAPGHHPAGKFIDDHDFAVLHDIMLVAVVERMRAHRGVQMMHQHDVGRIVKRRALRQQSVLDHQLFGILVTGLGQHHRVLLEINPDNRLRASSFFLRP